MFCVFCGFLILDSYFSHFSSMRAVIQRVSRAEVLVDSIIIGKIQHGLLVFLGVHGDDSEKDTRWMADKILNLRIFDDADGVMNRSLLDTGGSLLVVSQFTLFGDCRKGRRPSWSQAAPPDVAQIIYQNFVEVVRSLGVDTQTGKFQAEMVVNLSNDGPVTLLLDSHKNF
jgi:D-tyrosyl-tRNA(Tyr) deacylase